MNKSILLLSLLSSLLLFACGKSAEAPAGGDKAVEDNHEGHDHGSEGDSHAEAPKNHAEANATAGVKPGSHEDWCGEHAVPESQCTRCNPELIAAFKATGDWCAAHGLPESQCLICNPELKIERPPKSDEAKQ